MIIEKLEYFYVIAKYNSLSKAAEELHISISSLSTALKSLENELGYPLFTRIGRRLQINQQGQTILPSVMNIMNEVQTMQLPLFDPIKHPTIKIGTTHTAFIFKYQQAQPDMHHIQFSSGSALSLFNQLLQHKLDFVISSSIVDSLEFKQQLLTTLDFKIAISRKLLPHQQDHLSAQELNALPFILMRDHPAQCETTYKIARLLKIKPHYRDCPDGLGLCQLIDSGQGVALITSLEQALLATPAIAFIPIPLSYTINFYLYQSNHWPLCQQALTVKNQLQTLFARSKSNQSLNIGAD